jgi:hypothetical protein
MFILETAMGITVAGESSDGQRCSAPRAIFAGVKPIGAERMGNERLTLSVVPLPVARCDTAGHGNNVAGINALVGCKVASVMTVRASVAGKGAD